MTSKKIYLSLVLLIWGFSSIGILAVTYYVSPSGVSGAAGTIVAPLSLSSALSKSLTAGDSLILRGGQYNFSNSISISKSGNSTRFFTIVNYPGEIPILDFRNQSYDSASQGVKISGNFVLFKGIIVQGAGDNGMQVTGSNNRIENTTFRWNCDSGLQMKTGSDNLILNCDSYENFDYESLSGSNPNYGGNADGFADKQYTNTGTNTYKGCRSFRNADDGWDSYQKVGNTVYDSCWCYSNGPASFDMTDNIRFKTDSASWFYQFKNSAGRYVMTNYGNGNGFKLGGGYTANNATLHNCVSALNTVKGFDQNNNNGVMTIYNCTGYQNNPDYGFTNSSYGTLIIKNCASLASKSSNSLNTLSVTQDHNSWNPGFSCTSSYFVSVDYTQLIQNRQADGSLPEITFLHQTPSSGMIDVGTVVGLSYYGTAPDLGAFEYNPSSGISERESNSTVSVKYIPSEKVIVISAQTPITEVAIDDMCGHRVYRGQVLTNSTKIATSVLQKGVYLVKTNVQGQAEKINKVLLF